MLNRLNRPTKLNGLSILNRLNELNRLNRLNINMLNGLTRVKMFPCHTRRRRADITGARRATRLRHTTWPHDSHCGGRCHQGLTPQAHCLATRHPVGCAATKATLPAHAAPYADRGVGVTPDGTTGCLVRSLPLRENTQGFSGRDRRGCLLQGFLDFRIFSPNRMGGVYKNPW